MDLMGFLKGRPVHKAQNLANAAWALASVGMTDSPVFVAAPLEGYWAWALIRALSWDQ